MAIGKTADQMKKLADLVNKITAQKHREAAALEAARRARKQIQQRREFIPKRITPAKPIRIRL